MRHRPFDVSMSLSAPDMTTLRSEKVSAAKQHLRERLQQLGNPEVPELEARVAVEEAIADVQALHIPAMTFDFLKIMLGGEWKVVYSTVMPQPSVPRNEMGAPLVRVYKASQRFNFTSDESGKGEMINKLCWDLPSEEGVRGYLDVRCSFEVSSNGALEIEPEEHIIKPEKMPSDPEMCVGGLQGMSPEMFDPRGRWITSYADPDIRILSGMDQRLAGVIVVFERDEET